MRIIRFATAQSYEPEKDWKRTSLCAEKDISIEHFVKPPLHQSPMHSHPNVQVLIVLKGRLGIETEGGEEGIVEEGDAVYIPGDEAHVVKNACNQPSVGLDIFVPGRSFDFWLKKR